MRNPALDTWGDYDRDDPYPLFAQVQADGPVHEVTLADGHRAWLIAGHQEAKAALNHAALSKDMHAALARDGAVVAEGLPGPAFARHMLSADPPDHTRLRRLASAAFSRPRIAALRPRVQQITDGLLDGLEACGDTVVGARATGRGRGGFGEHRAVSDRAPRSQACRTGRGSGHRPGPRGRPGRRAVRA